MMILYQSSMYAQRLIIFHMHMEMSRLDKCQMLHSMVLNFLKCFPEYLCHAEILSKKEKIVT